MLAGLIQREPRNAEALTTRSIWALQDGDVAGAVASSRAATEADPGFAIAHLALGRALTAES